MLTLDYVNETAASVDQNQLHRHLETVLRRLGQPDKLKLELIVVGDQKITELNRQFLQHNYPTDVLSFPDDSIHPEPITERLLGSIVISFDTASRQASQAGIAVDTEINILATHGLLHLLGYHHQ